MTLAIPSEFSSANPTILARLQERHKRIIDANADAIAGKRVLDLASNNGRWSYGALAAGAKSVTSVEGRPDKVEEARQIMEKLGIAGDCTFHVGDIYDWLYENRGAAVDTIFCLGIFYHIMDHYRLLTLMARTAASTIIIDSGFVRSFRNSVHVQLEDPAAHRNALPKFEGQRAEFAGFVSLGLMIQMAWNLGFSCRPITWAPAEVEDREAVHDYMIGRRYTLRLDRTGAHQDTDWKASWHSALVALNPRFANLFDRKTHDSAVDDRVRRPFESMQFSVM